ncbi:DUF6611 family protein [Mycobacterium sp. Aquia_213]|uniref:DUF6611 family protein n=1 Tax=Mycobacterium sp. Aquia_213 TaxID=2991728 RepID=UPI002D1E417E|nr:DUF6611 family protein [Mycobacterium sp. Aquia_213]
MHDTRDRIAQPATVPTTKAELSTPRWWSRLLGGAHPWGSFVATVGRYGVQHFRLVIYPPGSSVADRQLAQLWRGWPISGAALGLVAMVLLGYVAASPDTVLAFAVACYVTIGALLFLAAGPTRVQVRSLSIALMPQAADARELHGYVEGLTLVAMLTRADRLLRAGAISSGEHEAIWREAYERLEAIHV